MDQPNPSQEAAPGRLGKAAACQQALGLKGLSFSSALAKTIPGKQGLMLGMKSWGRRFCYENLNILSWHDGIVVLKIAKLMKPKGI